MFWVHGVLLFCWIQTVSLQNLRFTIEPKSVIVRQGSPAILNCQTNIQTSDIIIQWKKGYKSRWIIDYKNKPYQLLSNYSLYFSSVGTGDEDVYFCAAYHSKTKTTIYSNSSAHITLAYLTSTFITSPQSSTILERQTATLTCISGASQPLPRVTWEKNGQPIMDQTIMRQNHLIKQNATTATLQLKNVSVLADTGYYRCVAINPLLPDEPSTSQQAYLLVQPTDDEPRIEVYPVNTISPRRHPLRLDCVIVGVPPPVVHWSHNNMLVTNNSNRMVYLNGSLVIRLLTLGDSGQYSCNGTNSKGSIASSDVFVNVAYIDFNFKRNPENVTAVNGTRAEVICEAPSHFPPRLRYKWYKGYRRINTNGRVSISSGNLVIFPVLKSDEDVYFCEASLEQFSTPPRTSTTGYLTVYVPPYFLVRPSDQTVVLGQTLRLTCQPAGFPEPTVTWYHGNMLLSNTSRLTLGADGSLVLNMMTINDAGQYKCSLRNDAGTNVAIATVTVHAPPNGTIMPSDVNVILGNNASFLCRFAGNPPPVIMWYFKGANERTVLLSRNSSRHIQSHELLTAVNVTEQDDGVYTCVGQNIVGMQNFSAKLLVLVPARFQHFPRNTTVNESDAAEITCVGYGVPVPSVKWSSRGNVLTNSSRVTVSDGYLRISNVTRNDTGSYSCVVKNDLKTERYSVYLTVQVSPSIHEVVGLSRVRWRQNTSFDCKSDGIPAPRIIWLKDMRKIQYTTRIYSRGSVLHIISSGNNDTGNYTCEASNLLGFAEGKIQLIVEVPPDEPINIKFGRISSTSLEVLWRPGFNGHSPITSYKLEIRANSTREWTTVSKQIKSESYTVNDLKPYTIYSVRVFAANNIGLSESSESIWNRTAEDFPSSPTHVQCQTLNSSAISLTWDEPSQPNGQIGKYRIQYSSHSNHALGDVNITSMSYHVNGLQPFTWYKFRVQAATGARPVFLWGNYSAYVKCRSGESAPAYSPMNFTVTSSGPHSVLAKWQKIRIGSENGIVTGYFLRYKISRDVNYTTMFIIGNETMQYNITGLAPWTVYEVQVAAMTVARGPWTVVRESRTNESVPSRQPSNVVVNAVTSDSLSISWDPPPLESQNGVILGYMVKYGVTDSAPISWSVTTNKTNLTISGLMIFTRYSVEVRAFTGVGFGPYSDGVMNKTLESYPSNVTGLTHNITKNSVILTWQPPHTPNGIITAYTTYLNTTTVRIFRRPGSNITMYNVTSQSREITTDETKVVLTGFYGNVTYLLCVAARTSVGYGPCTRNLIFTTNFTKQVTTEEEEHTSSLIDDHLPLIAGGAAFLLVLLIAIFVCCFIRRRKRMKERKDTKAATFNFQRNTLPVRSFDDGESSYASHGSRPIHAYSVDSSSMHSQTNPSNDYATPEGHDGSPFVRLRNSSLALGSDASSYDAPYSSVDEIGVDPTSVAPAYATAETPLHFVNTLYTERELEDSRGETRSLDSHTVINPIYEPNNTQVSPGMNPLYEPSNPRLESLTLPYGNEQGGMEDYPEGEGPLGLQTYGVLVLPPPPPEYSDFGDDTEDGSLHAYTNAVTDF